VNWESIGAIAEAIGAVGVIASLIYLAVQVRASTRASAVEAKLASTRMRTDFINYLIESPDLNNLFLQGRQSIEPLSTEEYYRFSNMALHAFSFLSAGYFQFCKGTLSEDDWNETRAVISFLLRGPGFREWWAKVGQYMFGDNFVSFVESEIKKIE
jgi:hypothetical protein